jgi:hypothetical protein
MRISWDFLGIGASSLCTVHCLALPLIAGSLPFFGLGYLAGHSMHKLLAFSVMLFCLCAIVPGYLRHKHRTVLVAMASGLSLVLFATFFSQATLGQAWELPLISLGNVLLIGSHLANRKLFKCNHQVCTEQT